MACPSCGSWAVKADRGLAGRMICARCGHPLGLGASPGPRLRRAARTRWVLPARWRVWLAVAGLVGVSAALAARAPEQELREVPGLQRGPSAPLGSPPPTGGLGM